ncbi:hypothetical protein G0Q06_06400 [Puniceicoccales bacterium CK1056]|uniref:TonB-dependent receptor plug domain-containing protein n=1 Tax=Oceanipulchritudo coccoides TaxID=2706888 RepID=A0A6B2LZC3_9BACT|nr:hypothetical protein [Oceanipulchritudo coccoides]NDV62071.1 hypothetical protein [Oceanipulchritudo coccoides]
MKHNRFLTLILLVSPLLMSVPIQAQQDSDDTDEEKEVFELSPFEVTTDGDIGYYASQTLSGGRIKSDISDLGTSVQVVTEELMQDLGATGADDVLLYTANTDVGGPSGNISTPSSDTSGTPDDSALRTNPAGNNRIRAIGSADLTRNFFRTDIPFDRYNSGRLDILRGANSFLFGLGSPSGILNYSLDRAEFRNSGSMSFWFTNEDLEENLSKRFDININRELVDDTLAVRVAVVKDEQEYIQELAHRDTRRFYGALTYKPFSERNIFFRVNGETGDLRSTPPSALGPLETLTPWLNDTAEAGSGGPANRFVADSFTNIVENNLPYQGMEEFNSGGNIVAARKWALVYDGTEDANGLPTRSIQNGVDNTMWVPGDTLFDPDNNFPASTDGGLYFFAYPNLHEIGGDFNGYRPQGLTDYSIFDFQKQLITGGFDRVNYDYDTYNFTLEATTKDLNFGIELAYNYESVDNVNTLPIRNPTLYMDLNRTHVTGPNSLFGDSNPNFGRIFITGSNAARNSTYTERETWRTTAFGKFDFSEKFDRGSLLAWLGRHTATLLLDTDTQNQRITQERMFAFGNDAAWHLQQDNSTQFQRQVNYTIYVSDAYPDAFTNPNFKATDFQISPRSDINLNLPENFSVPLSYYDLGPVGWKDPFTLVPGTDTSIGSSQVAEFNPAFGKADGSLSEEKVESVALNTQSYFLREHLVVNLGWRRDKWESKRANAPVSDDPLLEGQRDFSREVFNLDDIEANKVSDDNFSYNLVLKVPTSWLPHGYGFQIHYGEGSNFIPSTQSFGIDGTPIPSSSGTNKDYGFTVFAMDNKLIARFNWYETNIENEAYDGVSFPYAWTSTAHLTRQFNNMRRELWLWDKDNDGQLDRDDANGNGIRDGLEATGNNYLSLSELRQVYEVYASLMSPYLIETNDVQFNEATGAVSQGNGAYFTLADTADVEAKGMEVEIVYNPSRQFRVGMTLVRQEATRSNLAPRFSELFNALVDIHEAVPAIKGSSLGANKLSVPLVENVGATNKLWGQLTNSQYAGQAYYLNTALAGADNPEVRKWRASLYGNYSFTEGRLKGANIGAAYRYVDDAAIGYGLKTVGDDLTIPDVDTVYYDNDRHSFDIWAGYSFRIARGVNWRIQLNIRNLFADSDPLPIQTQPDGSVARVRYAPPRTFLLQNTITF